MESMAVVSAVTRGIKVTVETFYQEEYSAPLRSQYVFAYRITILNESDSTVRLLRRHWYIFDSVGETKEVEGPGVVGQQPFIQPGEYHQYISGCQLKSDMGTMHGTYLMERFQDEKQFFIKIPKFSLVAPGKVN